MGNTINIVLEEKASSLLLTQKLVNSSEISTRFGHISTSNSKKLAMFLHIWQFMPPPPPSE
jgi:hypothetical protein